MLSTKWWWTKQSRVTNLKARLHYAIWCVTLFLWLHWIYHVMLIMSLYAVTPREHSTVVTCSQYFLIGIDGNEQVDAIAKLAGQLQPEYVQVNYTNWYSTLREKMIGVWDERLVFSVQRFTSACVFLPYRTGFSMCICSCTVGKQQVPFSMAIANEKLIHECFHKHSGIGTARMK